MNGLLILKLDRKIYGEYTHNEIALISYCSNRKFRKDDAIIHDSAAIYGISTIGNGSVILENVIIGYLDNLIESECDFHNSF